MAAPEKLTGTLFGVHAVEEALRAGTRGVSALYVGEGAKGGRLARLEALARERGVRIRRVDTRTLDRLAGGGVHQGVLAAVDARPTVDIEDLLERVGGDKPCLIAVLDGVQDPHNLGAVVRNAALTGAAAVLVPRDRSPGVTATVEKVAAGGLEHVPVVRTGNLAAALRRLKEEGFWIFGAAGDGGEPLEKVEFPKRVAIVLGEEHGGLRRLTRETCDRLVAIPSTGAIDSYNLGTASGILLVWAYLARRGRGGATAAEYAGTHTSPQPKAGTRPR